MDKAILKNLCSTTLPKDVFERRNPTRSVHFEFLGSGFAQMFGEIVSVTVKTLSSVNLVAKRPHFR